VTGGSVALGEVAGQAAAVVRGHVAEGEIAAFLGRAFGDVVQVLAQQGQEPAGPPFGRYVPTGDGFDVEAGFPARAEITPTGRVESSRLPGGTVAEALHVGSYGTVGETYAAVAAWLEANGCEPAGIPWESYLDGPEVAEPRTLVHVPCRRNGAS
jgi:effector-binding domain-containing protein